MYYVTICTKNRENIFSNVIDVGADDPVRPYEEILWNFNKTNNNYIFKPTEIGKIVNDFWNAIPKIYKNVKLHDFIIMPNHIHGIIEISNVMGGQSRPPLQKIIQGFKSITTRECFRFGYRAIWQRNYYEHIIRNEKEYNTICEYINNNPIRYIYDKYYKT